jgi:serine/threonine protein phosphatase PrpC
MKIQIEEPLIFSLTGQRANNEDFVYPTAPTSDTRLFMVCDGIGGWDKGEVASRLVAEAIADYFQQYPPVAVTKTYLIDTITHAHLALAEYLQQNPLLSRVGSTLALLYLDEGGVTVAHVGDSRVYHLRKGQILHQTQDHRYVLELVSEGIITQEQAQTHPRRNSLSRSIGVESNNLSLKIDNPTVNYLTDIQAGDYFFLCTDGVLEQLNEEKLKEVFKNPSSQKGMFQIEQILSICQNQTRDNYSGCLVSIRDVIKEETFSTVSLPAKKSLRAWIGLAILWFSQLCFAQNGSTYAIVVGIADYKITDYRTGDLKFADKDALRFADFLKSPAGGNVPNQNIKVLTNKVATQKAILNALKLFEQATDQDRVIFYFSGHGLNGGFIPYDVKKNDPASVLTHRDVKNRFKSSAASTKLCIADACLSGSMTIQQAWNIPESKTLPKNADVVLMLSSRSTQSSVESGVARGGLFTFFLLNGLRGKADANHDKTVTIKELFRYVSPLLKRNTPNGQAPMFYGKFSDNLVLSYL